MRVGVRVWRKAFGMHDLFMLLGIVCVLSKDETKDLTDTNSGFSSL
jgi:hypothetical protein